ncbi:hypothetical protein, variant 1 [Aphanomyces invadans]|uniref:Uncharacterized protein n=1 Tax=Aphanomyces invadans TaxID=157072 RepID=A0A024TH24_9STRA|nr:hypothetical protein, variant 1 [Aphanomyces invadans]ETV93435.1 hypothetical protein, variant 1 [Aphanomyces invadans]|eukprot:XP_008877777.1 hypothetical protein, variant 1 [Aphanomyces invadans]
MEVTWYRVYSRAVPRRVSPVVSRANSVDFIEHARHCHCCARYGVSSPRVPLARGAYVVRFACVPLSSALCVDGRLKDGLSNALHRSIAAVPFLCVAASRYLYPALFERLFMMGVAIRSPSLASTLAKIHVDYFTWEYALSVVQFTLYRVVLMLILGTGSLVFTPFFGGLFAVVTFSFKVRRMEVVFALSLLVLYLVSRTRSTALELVRLWFDARAIARELFTPFVDRLPALKAQAISNRDSHQIYASILQWPKHQAILFGFSFTLSYLMQIPYIGPFVWLVGSVAAGHAIAQFIDRPASFPSPTEKLY